MRNEDILTIATSDIMDLCTFNDSMFSIPESDDLYRLLTSIDVYGANASQIASEMYKKEEHPIELADYFYVIAFVLANSDERDLVRLSRTYIAHASNILCDILDEETNPRDREYTLSLLGDVMSLLIATYRLEGKDAKSKNLKRRFVHEIQEMCGISKQEAKQLFNSASIVRPW